MMGNSLREFSEGEIEVRDRLQFELKSEFFIHPHLKQNIYKQEVFIFIPSPLQINPQTYSKEQFYLDQTTLIRYKTPSMTLSDLANANYSPSPLNRLQQFLDQSASDLSPTHAADELKLFGSIFKAAIRKRVKNMMTNRKQFKPQERENLIHSFDSLCSEISSVCFKYRQLQETVQTYLKDSQLVVYFKYVDEFISTTISEYLLALLKEFRSLKEPLPLADKKICELLLNEQSYRKKTNIPPKKPDKHSFAKESILYRQGLLNRFVLESLTLKNTRFSLEEKHRNILGALAAGIAMFVYMILFVWNPLSFGFNSLPFVALAVFLYILKDRIKEGFKNLYYQQAPHWFPDYSTEIQNFKGFNVGQLKENFGFIQLSQLPEEFLKIRNDHFHKELPALQRHESIIQFKREMLLYHSTKHTEERRRELATIFRFNIHRFLQNASDALEPHQTLDPETHQILESSLPKIYHLNLIIRNSSLQDDLQPKEEIKAFRVVVDKKGIKRVENIYPLLILCK